MNDDEFFLGSFHDPDCGQAKGRGRPKRGWVKIEATFDDGADGRWYCGWDCVAKVAAHELEVSK